MRAMAKQEKTAPEPENTAPKQREGAAPEPENTTHPHGYIQDKERYARRMKRIAGQVRGIERMIDEGKYCIDILTQISALTAALESVGIALLDDHMRHCVSEAVREGGDVAEEKLAELSTAIARFVRS